MKIGVAGGGIFGATAAIELARAFPAASIDLFEKHDDILRAASSINQCRLHRGYHYPRSLSTSRACKSSVGEFCEEYQDAVVTDYDHYYCIASENTKTSPEEFVDHCERLDLTYEQVNLDIVREDAVDLCLRVEEEQIDPIRLRELCWGRLREHGVTVNLSTVVDSVDDLDDYDYIVVATYANINPLVPSYPDLQREYKFQLIEKPVAEVPDRFAEKSLIILDGPFMGINPFGARDEFYFDHVVHGVRHSNIGLEPEVKGVPGEWLNDGIIRSVPDTNFSKFVEHGSDFFNGIEASRHLGSKFTIRAVLPDVDDTDSRPTLVDRSDDVFVVFAGKITTCVDAANRLVTAIKTDRQVA